MIADVIRKGNYFQVLNESGKKIKEIHESSVCVFKGAAGQYMTFIKGNYAVTFDMMFKKISERYL